MSDTIMWVVGAALAAAVTLIWLASWRRRIRMRRLMKGLLAEYFDGGIPADQFGKRSHDLASRHFLLSTEFYSLVISGFQRAFDAKFAQRARFDEDESMLVRRLAALKQEFGLTDRFCNEAWLRGRE